MWNYEQSVDINRETNESLVTTTSSSTLEKMDEVDTMVRLTKRRRLLLSCTQIAVCYRPVCCLSVLVYAASVFVWLIVGGAFEYLSFNQAATFVRSSVLTPLLALLLFTLCEFGVYQLMASARCSAFRSLHLTA